MNLKKTKKENELYKLKKKGNSFITLWVYINLNNKLFLLIIILYVIELYY